MQERPTSAIGITLGYREPLYNVECREPVNRKRVEKKRGIIWDWGSLWCQAHVTHQIEIDALHKYVVCFIALSPWSVC